METLKIEILNPEAKNLLNALENLNLIKITKEESTTDFSLLLKKLRKTKDQISLDDITHEVEQVRDARYEK